jgi:hypothetical protein
MTLTEPTTVTANFVLNTVTPPTIPNSPTGM